MKKEKIFKAYLFDFDGVIINSEPKRFYILKKCLRKFNMKFEKFITYHLLVLQRCVVRDKKVLHQVIMPHL